MVSLQQEIHAFGARRAETREALAGIGDAQITSRVEGQGDVRLLLWRIAAYRGSPRA